ncbi:hypothetical protein R1sor_001616 [Riccia sorocarpa]|uniref:Uncharacterized protein n=1 Tax=Riccia sorocarpa TaxID=122646 RepID=A0ABD3GZ40_9MARC
MSSQNVTILVSKSFVRDMPAADFALRFLHSRGTMSFQNVSILVSKSFVRDMLRTKRVIDQLSEILSTGKASRSDRVKGKSVDIAVGILTREQQLLRLIEEPNNLEVELTECIVLPEEPNPDQDWPSSVEQKQEERANMDPVLYARWDEFESYYHLMPASPSWLQWCGIVEASEDLKSPASMPFELFG